MDIMGFLGGLALALLFLVPGILIRYYRADGLIAGFNSASDEEKARYDIEGEAHAGQIEVESIRTFCTGTLVGPDSYPISLSVG